MFNNINRRTNETPMDWEWQTHGPIDPKSPFPQFKPQPGHKASFESPNSSSSFMKASSTPAPAFRNPSFTTPRKPFDADLMSEASGVESSPGDNADVDTPEPEPKKINAPMPAFAGVSERKPIFGRYGLGFKGISPARGELRRGKYGNALVHKVRKRKRLEKDYALVGRGSESESESEESRPRNQGQRSHDGGNKPGWFGSILSGIESRPQLPDILSYWAQLALNVFLIGIVIYAVASFYLTIRSDVNKAAEEEAKTAIEEIKICARDFLENKCAPETRLPAMKAVCENWELCMTRDPYKVGRARVSAHTFAQIFNSFIEPISWKAMIFTFVLVIACFSANNLVFGRFRSTSSHQQHPAPQYFPPPPQNFQWGNIPQTPSRNHYGYDALGNDPWQSIMPSQTPGQRSPSKGDRRPSRSRSPSKGNRYIMD